MAEVAAVLLHSAGFLVTFLAFVCSTDALFMWTAPSPAWNQTVPVNVEPNVQTAVIRVRNGTANYVLRWTYTLLDGQSISFSTFRVGESNTQLTDMGFVFNPGTPTESFTISNANDFPTRFISLQGNSENSTLTINMVNERENAFFQCKLQVGSNQWAYSIRIIVTVPSNIAHISDNKTVTEGADVTLNCTATGNPTPAINWTRLSDNVTVQMPLTNITRQEEGGYRCTADNGVGSPDIKDVFITVQYPPSINLISGNITVNDRDSVTLTCTADGFPAPNITWTRLLDNSSVPETFNITGKQDEGYYRCTADNGIGNPATGDIFITVKNYRPTNTRLVTNLHNNTVNLTGSVNLICSADANPPAKYRLYREQNSLINTTTGQDSFTYTTSVNERINQVTYSCTPFNDYGDGPTEAVNVTVHYYPANVTLVTNTTENKNCPDLLWVNFTCVASEANPAVESYRLSLDEQPIDVINSGTWNRGISEDGKHGYSCLAIHPVDNVRSSNNVTVTFNDLSQISVYLTKGSETVQEGVNVSLYCNISGFPEPTITWSKDGEPMNEPIQNRQLNFTVIQRDEAGNYSCHANNTCGKRDSSVKRIDVQYKPENVSLTVNISNNKVCAGVVVRFTCTAVVANPAPHNYTLFENESAVVQNMESPGVWIRQLNTAGEVTYRCEARNSIGNDSSSNTTITVEVPVNITVDLVHGNETLVEGGNVSLYCNAPGFPGLTVEWSTVDGQPVEQGSWLSFTRITRDKAGDYICHGSNTCGRTNSSVRSIDVQYKPENVTLNVNITISNNKVCADVVVNFTCTAEEANPAPHTYTLFRNESAVVQNMESPGVWIRRLNTAGEVTYRCEARNSISNDISSNTTFTVEVPASVTVENDTLVVKEGSNVTLFCIVSGFPSPSVSWVNNRSELMEAGNIWRIPNIRRNHTGEYNCLASNACGNDSKRAVIVVQYSPSDKGSGRNGSVSLGNSVSFTCPVDGNPEPNITWYKVNNAGGTVLFSGKTLNFSETKADDTGCYTCSASNFLGAENITQCLLVVSLPPTTTVQTTQKESLSPTTTVQITQKDPPKITPDNMTVNQNDTVSLNCTATGNPVPNITWTKLPENREVKMPFIVSGKQDEGYYRCTADNGVPFPDNRTIFLFVEKYHPININLVTNLTNSTAIVNESLTLTCSAQANPPAKYQLNKEQHLLSVSSTGSSSYPLTTSVTERVNQVTYSCIPFNDYGPGSTTTRTVTVIFPPEIGYVSSNQDVCEGSLVTLSCNATGSPPPSITWTRVADNGTDSEPLPAVDGTYEMNSITRSSNGTYRCTARNSAGTVNRTVQVTVRYSPIIYRILTSSNKVNEGGSFNMTCAASGFPSSINYTWIRLDNGERYNGDVLIFTRINRSDSGQYKCEAENHCGKGSRVQPIDVYFCEDDPDYADGCPEKAAIPTYCEYHEDFMRKHCPKSCGFCSQGQRKLYSSMAPGSS